MNMCPRTSFRIAWLAVLCALASVIRLPAQQPASPASADHKEDKSVNPSAAPESALQLSPFMVQSTRDKGYIVNDADVGMKTKQLLIDIPQSVVIIPRDMIEDLGFTTNTTELVKYAASGIISMGYGEGVQSRGFRASNPLIDGQVDSTYKSDPVSFDNYEIIKGPAAVLYGARTGLSGMISKNTKKPLYQQQGSLRVMVGNGSLLRTELDMGGPLGKLGNVPVQYRLVTAVQKFDGFRPTDYDNRIIFNGSLNFDLTPTTSLLLQVDNVHSKDKALTDYFVDAAGQNIYTGPGFEKGYSAKWDSLAVKRLWAKIILSQRFSENWEMKSSLTSTSLDRKDREIRNRAMPNYTLGTIEQYFFGWNFSSDIASAVVDVSGKYKIFGMKNTSNFGFTADHYHSLGGYWFLYTKPLTSITNPDSYNYPMPVYDKSNQSVPTDHVEVNAMGYYMHQLDVIENKLILTAGISTSYVETTDVNTSTNVASSIKKKGYPRRLGIIYKPIESVSLYVNNSTSFQTQGGFSDLNVSLPIVIGEVREVGVKTALFGGKISATVDYFSLEVTGLAVPAFNRPPYSDPAGKQKNQGFEMDLAFRPVPDWTIVGTFYSGDIKDAITGVRLANTTNHTASLLTKYDFSSGPLKGLSLGGSAYHQGSRYPQVVWKAYDVYNAFIGYQMKRCSITLNVDNVTDKFYSYGVVAAYYLDLANPRTTKLTFGYRF
jgi:iron complex outermembrane receptor protein